MWPPYCMVYPKYTSKERSSRIPIDCPPNSLNAGTWGKQQEKQDNRWNLAVSTINIRRRQLSKNQPYSKLVPHEPDIH